MVRPPRSAAPARSRVQHILSVIAALILLAALAAGATVVLAGLGYRLGWWDFRTGFGVLRWGAHAAFGVALGAALAALAALALGPRRTLALLLPALLVAGLATGLPWAQLMRARAAPPIHDISTDTENPPPFVDVLPLRAGAPNPAAYGGPEVAFQQRHVYPDLKPRLFAQPPGALFPVALEAARGMGWEVVAAVPAEGRIEATATTLWFGFKDDVVVRIMAHEEGSRLDVRSVSRVGRGDLGANARRIRAYLDALPESQPVH